jgi:hypothetical protein
VLYLGQLLVVIAIVLLAALLLPALHATGRAGRRLPLKPNSGGLATQLYAGDNDWLPKDGTPGGTSTKEITIDLPRARWVYEMPGIPPTIDPGRSLWICQPTRGATTPTPVSLLPERAR